MSNIQIDELNHFAEGFKALSNPNRLHLFLRLVSCCPPGTECISDAEGQRCVGELGQNLEIDPSTVSHHLKELRRSGLLRMERRGKNIICWVDREMVLELANLLTGYRSLETVKEKERVNAGEGT